MRVAWFLACWFGVSACWWVGVRVVVSDAHARASFRVFCFVVLVLLVCFVNNAAWAGWVGLVRRAGRVLGLCGYWVVVLVVGESVCLWALVFVVGCECSACLLV